MTNKVNSDSITKGIHYLNEMIKEEMTPMIIVYNQVKDIFESESIFNTIVRGNDKYRVTFRPATAEGIDMDCIEYTLSIREDLELIHHVCLSIITTGAQTVIFFEKVRYDELDHGLRLYDKTGKCIAGIYLRRY